MHDVSMIDVVLLQCTHGLAGTRTIEATMGAKGQGWKLSCLMLLLAAAFQRASAQDVRTVQVRSHVLQPFLVTLFVSVALYCWKWSVQWIVHAPVL